MTTAKLRKVGGSVMLPVPPAILNMADLAAGSTVEITLKGKVLEIKVAPRPRYTLDQLLDESAHTYPLPPEEREWVDAPPVGREII
jgi:antitoxin ChpS